MCSRQLIKTGRSRCRANGKRCLKNSQLVCGQERGNVSLRDLLRAGNR